MRKSLQELIKKTIVFEYTLPHADKSISRSSYSSIDDSCYSLTDDQDISEIIYNSIIEYSFNQFDLEDADYTNLLSRALQSKLKFDDTKKEPANLQQGFFGEVLLYCFLFLKYNAIPLISRGYFYSPLENSETKGYDSYHLIQNGDNLELWFGEVKFHASCPSTVKSVLDKIEIAISDNYLQKNLITIFEKDSPFNITGSKIEHILNEWKKNVKINILDEAKKHNIKLVYPILLIFDEYKDGFDESVKEAIKHIEDYKPPKTVKLSIEVSIFFIFTTVKNTKKIKLDVLEWIKNNKPLMS